MTREKALAKANDIIDRLGLDPCDGDTAAEIADALMAAYQEGVSAPHRAEEG